MRHSLAIMLCTACFLGACASAPQRPAMHAGESADSKYAGNDLLYAVAWMQTSIEHDLVYAGIYKMAETQLLAALADPH